MNSLCKIELARGADGRTSRNRRKIVRPPSSHRAYFSNSIYSKERAQGEREQRDRTRLVELTESGSEREESAGGERDDDEDEEGEEQKRRVEAMCVHHPQSGFLFFLPRSL